MLIDKKLHDNIILESKELHDMLLKGYRHAVIVKIDSKVEDSNEEEGDGSGGTQGDNFLKPKHVPHLSTHTDVIYNFNRNGMTFHIAGFEDKEAARMAYEESLDLIIKDDYYYRQEIEDCRREVQLLDLKKHLTPKLNYD